MWFCVLASHTSSNDAHCCISAAVSLGKSPELDDTQWNETATSDTVIVTLLFLLLFKKPYTFHSHSECVMIAEPASKSGGLERGRDCFRARVQVFVLIVKVIASFNLISDDWAQCETSHNGSWVQLPTARLTCKHVETLRKRNGEGKAGPLFAAAATCLHVWQRKALGCGALALGRWLL